jgi:DNA polymerase III epsilon subunit-like protein
MATAKTAPRARKSPQVKTTAPIITLVYDNETTGLLKPEVSDLSQQPKIIEFAVVAIDQSYDRLSEHSWLIHPGEDITPEITKITGLKNEDLRGKPSFIQVLPEIEQVFLGKHRVMAHNLPFDWGMLTNELKRVGREYAFPYPPIQQCTVQLASDLIFGRRAKMTELYEKTLGKPLAQTHRALDDVNALVEIISAQRW